MTIDNLASWFTVGLVQCLFIHTSALTTVHYSFYWIAQIHEPIVALLSSYKGPMLLSSMHATHNALKSNTM